MIQYKVLCVLVVSLSIQRESPKKNWPSAFSSASESESESSSWEAKDHLLGSRRVGPIPDPFGLRHKAPGSHKKVFLYLITVQSTWEHTAKMVVTVGGGLDWQVRHTESRA